MGLETANGIGDRLFALFCSGDKKREKEVCVCAMVENERTNDNKSSKINDGDESWNGKWDGRWDVLVVRLGDDCGASTQHRHTTHFLWWLSHMPSTCWTTTTTIPLPIRRKETTASNSTDRYRANEIDRERVDRCRVWLWEGLGAATLVLGAACCEFGAASVLLLTVPTFFPSNTIKYTLHCRCIPGTLKNYSRPTHMKFSSMGRGSQEGFLQTVDHILHKWQHPRPSFVLPLSQKRCPRRTRGKQSLSLAPNVPQPPNSTIGLLCSSQARGKSMEPMQAWLRVSVRVG